MALRLGDLTNDGRTGIVWIDLTAYSVGPRLPVLLAGANAQYSPAPDRALPFTPISLFCIVEDVTGDKRNDLVCVGVANTYAEAFLVTYPGNGDGTFAARRKYQRSMGPEFLDGGHRAERAERWFGA